MEEMEKERSGSDTEATDEPPLKRPNREPTELSEPLLEFRSNTVLPGGRIIKTRFPLLVKMVQRFLGPQPTSVP